MTDTIDLSDALADLGVPVTQVDVTTGASPLDVTVPSGTGRLIINVTSGGTGGVEVLNVPAASGLINAGLNVIVVFSTQNNPSDVIKLQADGSDTIYFYN